MLAGSASQEVEKLLSALKENLQHAKLSQSQQETYLARVKVLGRDIKAAGPIFTRSGVSVLSQYGLDQPASNVSREALRCLANAFLLNEPARQIFVDLGYATKTADRLEAESVDDEFLLSRILFLMTYNTNLDFESLANKNKLAESINACIARHAQHNAGTKHSAIDSTAMNTMALTETLKLIFNITYFTPKLAPLFLTSLEPIVGLILDYPLPQPPLQPPMGSMLNALLNLDLSIPEGTQQQDASISIRNSVFPSDSDHFMKRLIFILDHATRAYPETDLEQAAAPLCTLLRRFYELAPLPVKKSMKVQILPGEKDRDKPLGRGDSLSDRLLRLSSSPKLPALKENISNLLFELSDKDPNRFVQNIGYGYASGFLMSHNLQVSPSSIGEDNNDDQTCGGTAIDVNPITGQRLDSEARDASSSAQMTDEEKEREAERLFVLFERLKATGVVDVRNPVEQANDEGRFEELE